MTHPLAATNFTPAAVGLLVAGGAVALVWAVYFAIRWAATLPNLPPPGPETSDLGPEPPAIANFLVNRCHVTTAAAAATLIDLAARKHLELFEAGPDHFVVRLCDGPAEPLTDYEQQVVALVRAKATGGSAPLEAIELDDGEADSWRDRFAKSVIADAKSRGLLRGRWTPTDWAVFGALAAVALLLLAVGLFVAHVEQAPDKNGKGGFDRDTWFYVALAGWFALMAGLRLLRSIRYSAAGEAAAARWLGMKRFLQHDPSFADTPPAGVAIWNRLLSYGAAIGVARAAVAAVPLETEDPEIAWSRMGGEWHQVHVEYPTHFGYGQRPQSVFVTGLLHALFWGVIAFVALPWIADTAWTVGSQALDHTNDGAVVGVVGAFALVFGVLSVLLVVRLAGALIRTYRGVSDLRKTVTVSGQVVKHRRTEGTTWFAVDPGEVDEVRACHPGDDGTLPPRGATVRMVITPHLHHVVSVEVMAAAQ